MDKFDYITATIEEEKVRVEKTIKYLKEILDNLNLKSFLKTSGGKGYHICIPFKNNLTWKKFYKISTHTFPQKRIYQNIKYDYSCFNPDLHSFSFFVSIQSFDNQTRGTE